MSNLFSYLHKSVKQFPEKIFAIDKGQQWTYSAIYEKITILAKYLSDLNINHGDRIVIYMDNSVEYIIAFYAVLLINGIVVPININSSFESLQFIINETEPKAFISNSMSFKRLEGKANFFLCNMLVIDKILDNVEVNKVEPEINIINFDLYDDSYVAVILYTSGTTKVSKGVMLTHKNLSANTESILEYLNLTYNDSVLVTIPFSYSYGNSLLLTHTKVGGCLHIENRVSYPIKVLEELQSGKVTGFSTVGSYLNILLKQEYIKNIDQY